jgi:hypothetical protein
MMGGEVEDAISQHAALLTPLAAHYRGPADDQVRHREE